MQSQRVLKKPELVLSFWCKVACSIQHFHVGYEREKTAGKSNEHGKYGLYELFLFLFSLFYCVLG